MFRVYQVGALYPGGLADSHSRLSPSSFAEGRTFLAILAILLERLSKKYVPVPFGIVLIVLTRVPSCSRLRSASARSVVRTDLSLGWSFRSPPITMSAYGSALTS